MNIGEAKKINGGEILKLDGLHYLVGKKVSELYFELWNCDESGERISGSVGKVKLTGYDFKIFKESKNKILKEAVDF